jgi:hypothetical protein
MQHEHTSLAVSLVMCTLQSPAAVVFSESDAMRLAVLTVSPNVLKRGLAIPTTPAESRPEHRPILTDVGLPSGRLMLLMMDCTTGVKGDRDVRNCVRQRNAGREGEKEWSELMKVSALYVHIYIYIYIYTHTHTHTHIYMHLCARERGR